MGWSVIMAFPGHTHSFLLLFMRESRKFCQGGGGGGGAYHQLSANDFSMSSIER